MNIVQIYHPEKLVPGRYNIIAVSSFAAILWKDNEFFFIRKTEPEKLVPLTIERTASVLYHGLYVEYDPIPLKNISEWQERAKEFPPLRDYGNL